MSNLEVGKYTVSVTGYNMPESNSATIVYLSDEVKEEIKNAINGAVSLENIKAVVEQYKEQLNLAEKMYTDNTFNTIYEQLPYESYDQAVEMIYKSASLLEELNSADWSKYTELFVDNEDIILKGADKLEAYKSYSANQQNVINKIIVESSPFASFAALRTAFCSAVKEYGNSSSGSSGSG